MVFGSCDGLEAYSLTSLDAPGVMAAAAEGLMALSRRPSPTAAAASVSATVSMSADTDDAFPSTASQRIVNGR